MSANFLPELTPPIRFGAFELDPRTRVLRKHGVRIRLQNQPLEVLLALLERPGEVITREQLREKIWEGAEFGDLDHRLNIAVNKIREVLGDSPAHPRYVETVPRRGYRFVAAVEASAAQSTPAPLDIVPPTKKRHHSWLLPAGAGVALALALAGAFLLRSMGDAPRNLQIRRLTNDNSPKFGAVLSDGARLYFMAGSQFDSYVAQLPLAGGEPARLPVVLPPGRYVNLLDITADRQDLLLNASDTPMWSLHAQQPAPLWTVRIADGSTRRVGALLAQEARYSPDGRHIALVMIRASTPGALWTASSDGSSPHLLLQVDGVDILAPFWSPDGDRILFAERDQHTQVDTTWEIRASGGGLRRLFPDWNRSHRPAGWAPNGSLLISSDGRLWIAAPRRSFQGEILRAPISPDEPHFESVVPSLDHHSLHGIGDTPLGQLQRFELTRRTWEAHLGGISAEMVEYSPDGERLAYITYPGHELWTRRADGTEPIRLTEAPTQATLPRWSPDGTLLGFLGNETAANDRWQIYVVNATGGPPRLACRQNCAAQGDFNWTADGKRIIYDSARAALCSLDVAAGTATKMPGTEGLYSPRISPDGSMLAALDWRSGSDRLMILRFVDGKWKQTAETAGFIKWPYWSRDSRTVWYLNAVKGAIARYDVIHDRHEDVVPIRMEEITGQHGTWFALTPRNEPMVLFRRDIQQIYALGWNTR